MSTAGALATRRAFGDFIIDCNDERLLGPDGPVRIGNKAYQVLCQLIEKEGSLLTKDVLFTSVWDGMAVSESSLTSVIKELRRALDDDPRAPRYIESVYGRGYRLIPEVSGALAAPAAEARSLATEPAVASERSGHGQPPLVVVSPFQDDAVRATHPFCAEELREEILSGLSRVREIQLIADEGGRATRDDERGYHLTATLLPHGSAVKVIARAKRLADGRVVWAETLPLAAGGGTAQGVEKIVRRIVAAALPAVDDDVLLDLPQDPGDLYDAYLVARRRSFTASTYAEAAEAGEALERIIAEQPGFGLAYPPLVRLYNTDFNSTALGLTGKDQRATALALAKRGLAADRRNAHAHSALGWCHIWHGQREQALRSFNQALALNPYNRVRVQEAATALLFLDYFGRSRDLLARAIELDPVPDDDISEEMARLELVCGDYEAALRWLERIVEPTTIWMNLYLGACEIALKRPAAVARVRRWRSVVNERWHGGKAPDTEQVLDWVRLHHPLPADKSEAFFAPIDAVITAAGAAG